MVPLTRVLWQTRVVNYLVATNTSWFWVLTTTVEAAHLRSGLLSHQKAASDPRSETHKGVCKNPSHMKLAFSNEKEGASKWSAQVYNLTLEE
jgi:hypothetical protein